MIAIDTNLLVYAHRSEVPEHELAQAAIERAIESERGWGISAPCLSEFWAVVTHPGSIGGASTPEEASEFIHQLVENGSGSVWYPDSGFAERLFLLADQLKVSGCRIFDLQIGLIAQDNGADQLWSHDGKFIRIPGLKILDPL